MHSQMVGTQKTGTSPDANASFRATSWNFHYLIYFIIISPTSYFQNCIQRLRLGRIGINEVETFFSDNTITHLAQNLAWNSIL